MTRPLRSWGRRLAAPALGLAACLLTAPAAFAQEAAPTAEELGLAVEIGYEDLHVGSAAWLPVEVRIDPARALEATLAVESQSLGGRVRSERAVSSAARTPRVYRFLVPSGSVVVEVSEPGREPLTVRGDPDVRTADYLVGRFDEDPRGPTLESAATGLDGAWVGVDPAWVALSAQALAPLSAVVAHGEHLEALTPAGARNLVAGVAAGTDLIVVAGQDGLPLLPAELPSPVEGVSGTEGDRALVPTGDAWALRHRDADAGGDDDIIGAAVPFGRGRVIALTVAPDLSSDLGVSVGLWSTLTGPSARPHSDPNWSPDRSPFQFSRLLADAEGNAPTLPWLAAFTAAYVLVVGPVNGLVLSRLGRRELAWATVPMVTLVFTAGAWLGVSGARPPVGLAGEVTWWVDGVGTEAVAVIARAPTEGTAEIRVDGEGWVATTLVDGARLATVDTAGDAALAQLDLAALQQGGLLATRTTDSPPPLAVDAVAGSDGVSVTVTNTGAEAVDDVTVTAATASRSIGTLAPGSSETIEIGPGLLPGADPFLDPFAEVVGGPPESLKALLLGGPMDRGPGLVWAVGTLPSAETDVRVDGEPAQDRGGLVAVAERPRLVAGVTSPYAVDRMLVVDDVNSFRPSPWAVENAGEAFVRYRLPAGTDLAALRTDLAAQRFGGQVTYQVFVPAANVSFDLDEVFRDRPREVVNALGEVWISASGELFPFDTSSHSLHTLEEQ